MPFGDPQPVQMFPAQISVPTNNGLSISMSIQSDGGTATPDDIKAAVTSLVDLLQGWPGKHPNGDVTAQFYSVEMIPATPTNPVPQPDPEPAPEG